jgi:hypothetical protein|tara:strand:+ start:3835 stop:4806 length:972 start_codon:yes stop_codon:yes gene_type:complete
MPAEYSEKEKEKEKEDKKNQTPFGTKLLRFFIYVIISFIIVFFTGLLGANFTFLTSMSKESLDKLFPVDENKPPYSGEKKTGGKNMIGGVGGGTSKINITKNTLINEPFFSGALFDYGFPYSMENKDSSSFLSILGNWLVNKITYSNIWLNRSIRKLLEFIGEIDAFIPISFQELIPFILGPLFIGIIICMSALWWLPTLISTFMEETGGRNATIISVVGLFLGWTWLIPVLISVAQIGSVLFKFILMPGLVSEKPQGNEKRGNYLLDILGNKYNTYYMSILFCILSSISAFINFDVPQAIVMLIVFIFASVKLNRSKMANVK